MFAFRNFICWQAKHNLFDYVSYGLTIWEETSFMHIYCSARERALQ